MYVWYGYLGYIGTSKSDTEYSFVEIKHDTKKNRCAELQRLYLCIFAELGTKSELK